MQKDNRDLTAGKITQNLVYLAIPILMTYILQDAFEVIDMIFIGRLGSPKLAAVAMSGNILRLITVIGLGISTGATVVVSQSIGAKKQAEGENIALQSLLLSVFFRWHLRDWLPAICIFAKNTGCGTRNCTARCALHANYLPRFDYEVPINDTEFNISRGWRCGNTYASSHFCHSAEHHT